LPIEVYLLPGIVVQNLASGFEAVQRWHADIKNHDIRFEVSNLLHCLAAVTSFTAYFPAGARCQQRADTGTHDGAKALIAAIEALQENRTYFNSRVGEIVLNGFLNTRKMPSQKAPVLPDLTAREREIVQLLAEGKAQKRRRLWV